MQNGKQHKVNCGECEKPMVLRNSSYGQFYGCTGYPECKGTHGAHPDGRPLGTPADKQTKEMRTHIHEMCGKIWGEWKSPDCDKEGMYGWLEKYAPSKHIGQMDMDHLIITEKLLIEHFNME